MIESLVSMFILLEKIFDYFHIDILSKLKQKKYLREWEITSPVWGGIWRQGLWGQFQNMEFIILKIVPPAVT